MVVGADGNGFYDYATGENVELVYDQQTGQFYNALTGESAELIGDAINAARDTLIGIFGRQGYPNNRGNQYPQRNPQQFPQQFPQDRRGESPGSFNTQGVNLKWYTLLGIGAAVGLVFAGKRLR